MTKKTQAVGTATATGGSGMSTLMLVAGLVLRLTSGWFPQQHLVGDILLWISLGPLALILAIVLVICVLAGLAKALSR